MICGASRSLFVPYRVEDTDDILQLVSEQTKLLSGHRPYFLSELIESQSQESHAAVCEVCSSCSPSLT